MVSVTTVSMRYGAKVLFDDVSTSFAPGKRFGLTGPNGAGKIGGKIGDGKSGENRGKIGDRENRGRGKSGTENRGQTELTLFVPA
jgi:ABC-type hemin transport system ATPase subunit